MDEEPPLNQLMRTDPRIREAFARTVVDLTLKEAHVSKYLNAPDSIPFAIWFWALAETGKSVVGPVTEKKG
jgi:hypothetical protein